MVGGQRLFDHHYRRYWRQIGTKTMTNSNDRHIVQNATGGWDVKAPGACRSSAHTDTQAQAIDRGRQIVGKQAVGS